MVNQRTYRIKYKIIYNIRQTTAMNKNHSNGGSGAPAGLVGGGPVAAVAGILLLFNRHVALTALRALNFT